MTNTPSYMRPSFLRLSLFVITSGLAFVACGDAVRDDFPRRNFIGYFDLRYSEYSGNVFTARSDMRGDDVGINGIVLFNSGGNYYAFDLMCPYEKSSGCTVTVDIDNNPSVADCECCGSRFLLASPYGEVIEGPAKQGLHSYQTGVKDNILVVSSGY